MAKHKVQQQSDWWARYASAYGELDRIRYRVIHVPVAQQPSFVVHEYLVPADPAQLDPEDYREVARFWKQTEADNYVRNLNSRESIGESATAMRKACES